MTLFRSAARVLVMTVAAGGGVVSGEEDLAPGYVRGDVVSYSYVPNKFWTRAESFGKLPYLIEYSLMEHKDDWQPLETHHAENIRRIDMASQWSTVIMLYPRHDYYRDEIINLMIRCFRNRQLVELGEPWAPGDPDPYYRVIHILEALWSNRDTVLTSPDGDQATGRQLINNIMMVGVGDEVECTCGTSGLETIHQAFRDNVKYRVMDGEQPFTHIKAWYNMVGYGIGCYAATQADYDNGRKKIPANAEFIGTDVYHYWTWTWGSPDPVDLTPEQRQPLAQAWQDIITKYYPGGLSISPCGQWRPECQNETQAMMGAIDLAGAPEAMMFFIGCSSQVKGCSYTTPAETMDAYYDNLKAGPWVGLSWWTFGDFSDFNEGGLRYMDRTLVHYTEAHPEGLPYTPAQLDMWHDSYLASKLRMFNDVTQNQLVAPLIAQVSPDPAPAYINQQYTRSLTLARGSPAPSWSVVQGPGGTQINASGKVSGWTPTVDDIGQLFMLEVRAGSYMGQDYRSWTVRVKSRGDFDDDNDVDQADFGHLQLCLVGSGALSPAGCADADLSKDGDVDLDDAGLFLQCFAGPSQPPGC